MNYLRDSDTGSESYLIFDWGSQSIAQSKFQRASPMGKRSNKVICFPSVNAFSENFSKNFSAGLPIEKWRAEESPVPPARKKNFQKNDARLLAPGAPLGAPGSGPGLCRRGGWPPAITRQVPRFLTVTPLRRRGGRVGNGSAW